MSSNINYTAIDVTYPVAGIDNNTQGFRDNFMAIKNGLSTASSEISELQNSISFIGRTDVYGNTTSIAHNATANLTIVGYKGYVLYSVETTSTVGGAWVRIYTDPSSRTADASRLISEQPTTTGLVAEVITTGNTKFPIVPGIIGFNNEDTPTSNIYVSVTNTNTSSGTFTVTLTILPIEQ